LYIDLNDRVDYGFGKDRSLRRSSPISPNQSPLLEGEGPDRGVWLYTST
jgi:hypothetical protein